MIFPRKMFASTDPVNQLSRPDAVHIHDWHDAADDDRKLHEPRGSQFFRTDSRDRKLRTHRPAFSLICRMPAPI